MTAEKSTARVDFAALQLTVEREAKRLADAIAASSSQQTAAAGAVVTTAAEVSRLNARGGAAVSAWCARVAEVTDAVATGAAERVARAGAADAAAHAETQRGVEQSGRELVAASGEVLAALSECAERQGVLQVRPPCACL